MRGTGVAQVATARGIPRAQVALAWLLSKPVITAPIVGATKLHHLDDSGPDLPHTGSNNVSWSGPLASNMADATTPQTVAVSPM